MATAEEKEIERLSGILENAVAEVIADNNRLRAQRDALLAALKAVEPYVDAIVCYASTMEEYEPNRIAHTVRAALKLAEGK